MLEIERLRKAQLGQLNALCDTAGGMMTAAATSALPAGSLTSVAPLLQPQARSLVEGFPQQATAIAIKHGLSAQEFNTLLHAVRRNKAFQKKVQRAFGRPTK
jgi:Domain of unknown function (DUF4168)